MLNEQYNYITKSQQYPFSSVYIDFYITCIMSVNSIHASVICCIILTDVK